MSPPAIAILTPAAPPDTSGGVANAHANIYRCLSRLGCQTSLMSFNDTGASSGDPGISRFGTPKWLKALLALGTCLHLKLLGSRKQAYQLADIVYAIPGVLQLNRRLKRLKPEIIILPDHCAPGLFLHKGNTPVILVVHHIPSRFNASPLLGDFCSVDVEQATKLEQRVLKKVDAVVCPSDYMKQVFRATYRFDGEVTVIPNLINEDWLEGVPAKDVRNELGLSGDVPVVYIPSAGSLFKGSKYVFEIVRRLAGASDGPLAFYLSGHIGAELLAELAHVPENAHLFMPGQVGHDDNLGFVKSCSFGISPTLIESFGMAILEAGYCNVPMVAFSVGGTDEVICDGESGFLVPLLDLEGLLAKAVMMLNREHCARLQVAAGQSVRKRFNTKRIEREYLALCERHVEKPVS